MLRQWKLGSLVVSAALMVAATAGGVDLKPDDIIADRQAGFDLQLGLTSAMKAGVASDEDVKQYQDAAKGLMSWARVIPTMFPDGTQTGHDTNAKPEIWTNRSNFEKAAADLYGAAKTLQALAAADDRAGFAAQLKLTSGACGACHKQFRANWPG